MQVKVQISLNTGVNQVNIVLATVPHVPHCYVVIYIERCFLNSTQTAVWHALDKWYLHIQ